MVSILSLPANLLETTLSHTHLQTFVNQVPQKQFSCEFSENFKIAIVISKCSFVWVHNFARPLFFKTSEIKNSNEKLDLYPHRDNVSTRFMFLHVYSQSNNYEVLLSVLQIKILALLCWSQSAFTCSKLTIETLEQGVKYVQN